MKSSFIFFGIMAGLMVSLWSCDKEPAHRPDSSLRVLFSVDEESLSFATKASTGISVVTALEAFNVLAVTGEPDAYEAAWQTPVMAFAKEGSVYANEDVLWPREDPGWTFYACNLLEPQIASGRPILTVPGNTADYVVASRAGVYSEVNALAFNHLFSRLGNITITPEDGTTIENLSMWLTPVVGGTFDILAANAASVSGRYETRAGWSELIEGEPVMIASTSGVNGNDVWLVPGTYEVHASWRTVFDDDGSYVDMEDVVQEMTIKGGLMNSVTAYVNATHPDPLVPLTFTVSVANFMQNTMPAMYFGYSHYPGSLDNPLTFDIVTPGKILWKNVETYSRSIEYSLNGGEWTALASTQAGAAVTVAAGDMISFRGDEHTYGTEYPNAARMGYTSFAVADGCTFNARGNVMSLLLGYEHQDYWLWGLFKENDGLLSAASLELPCDKLATGCYGEMFAGCSHMTAAPALPATQLGQDCYFRMFRACSELATAPALPATTLVPYCYAQMFRASGLTSAPALPATVLASSCYEGMFMQCASLASGPVLPATTLANSCYTAMFARSGLTTAPELPATTLASSCYGYGPGDSSMAGSEHQFYRWWNRDTFLGMFEGCKSLTTPPVLPATELTWACYGSMFEDSAIETAPVLPATVLAQAAYFEMFKKCTSLTAAPELPAMTLAAYCYSGMFAESGLVHAPALPATTLAQNCYGGHITNSFSSYNLSGMFQYCSSLVDAPVLPAETLVYGCYDSMFMYCPQISEVECHATDISATDCTRSWLLGAAAEGTFRKAATMTSWTEGTSGIPAGWSVSDL